MSDADAAREALWRTGELWWKLDKDQRRVYRTVRKWMAEGRRRGILDCGRRWGKDTVSFLVAVEEAIRRPGSRIPYAASTQDSVKELLLPTARWIVADAPEDVRPVWRASDHAFVLPNGSRIPMAGLDLYPDRLRGPYMDFGIISEAGFVADLEYVVNSIFSPMMLGRSGAFLLMNSTPARSGAHPWETLFLPSAKASGTHVYRKVTDSPRYGKGELEAMCADVGGPLSMTWRREFLCEHIVDEEWAVVPEFARVESECVREQPRPSHYDAYVAMDVGFVDLSVALFAYRDFKAARTIIEDELVLSRMTTQELAEGLRQKESELWGDRFAQKTPAGVRGPKLLRVSDTDLIVINDLTKLHKIEFQPTAKDDLEAAVNAVRLAVGRKEIVIHPRCKTLIAHLRHAVWNKQRTAFDRSDEKGLSHFDALAALVYLERNINKTRNPYPLLDASVKEETHFIRPGAAMNDVDKLAIMLGRKRRRAS